MSNKCLKCEKPITSIPGRRPRLYCSDSCRVGHFNILKRMAAEKPDVKNKKDPATKKDKKFIQIKKATKSSFDGKNKISIIHDEMGPAVQIVVQDLTKPTHQVKPITDPKPKTNTVIKTGSSYLEQRRNSKLGKK